MFDDFMPRDHKQFIPVVEDHSRRKTAVGFEDINVSSFTVKDLDPLGVAHINAALSVDRNSARRTKLSRSIAVTTKPIDIFSVWAKFKHRIIERAQRVDITQTVDGNACIEF